MDVNQPCNNFMRIYNLHKDRFSRSLCAYNLSFFFVFRALCEKYPLSSHKHLKRVKSVIVDGRYQPLAWIIT